MKLKLISTSIGNIEDINIRAIRAIFETEIILAEDTRVFAKLKGIWLERYTELLKSLNIDISFNQQVKSYREQNHGYVINFVIDSLKNEKSIGFLSDAGMPGISDPGYKLVRDVVNEGFEVEVIPGPSAVLSSLLYSAIPTDYYSFVGFLPRRSSRALNLLKKFLIDKSSVVFFESPYRIIKTLELIQNEFGDGIEVAACAEMTKKFEAIYRGKIFEVIQALKKIKPKGEWSIVVRKL